MRRALSGRLIGGGVRGVLVELAVVTLLAGLAGLVAIAALWLS